MQDIAKEIEDMKKSLSALEAKAKAGMGCVLSENPEVETRVIFDPEYYESEYYAPCPIFPFLKFKRPYVGSWRG